MMRCKVYWKRLKPGDPAVVREFYFENYKDIERYIKKSMRWTMFRVMVLIKEEL